MADHGLQLARQMLLPRKEQHLGCFIHWSTQPTVFTISNVPPDNLPPSSIVRSGGKLIGCLSGIPYSYPVRSKGVPSGQSDDR